MTGQSDSSPQTALITGASAGIGAAAAMALAERGFRVCLIARRQELLQQIAQRICSQTNRPDAALAIAGDVTRPDDRDRAIDQAMDAFGHLDVLVNNAGTARAGALEDVPLDEARDQFELNTLAPMAMMQRIGPIFRQQEQGRIINVSSVSGMLAAPGLGVYSATKYALEALSDAARREYEPWGIRVSIIQPGGIATDIWDSAKDALTHRRTQNPDSPFHDFYDFQLRQLDDLLHGGTPVELVCKAIVHAATARRPRPRYCMPAYCLQRKVVSHFPTSWEDWIVRRFVRVQRPAAPDRPSSATHERTDA